MEEIQDRISEALIDIPDLISRIEAEEGRTPFINVFYQECQYMNTLVTEMQKSLEVLHLGLIGELQMSDAMETLMNSLYDGRVPSTWEKVAFVSMRPLASWMDNLVQRIKQLLDWTIDLGMPKAVWVGGFFNPQSFRTAILQTQARKNEWALDQVVVSTEVTKKSLEEVEVASKDGSFIWGLSMEGARWDGGGGTVNQSLPKEMFCEMPVMLAKAIPVDKAEYKDTFMCPVYKVQQRGHTYVFQANLKTRVDHTTWIIAGVALLMDVVL